VSWTTSLFAHTHNKAFFILSWQIQSKDWCAAGPTLAQLLNSLLKSYRLIQSIMFLSSWRSRQIVMFVAIDTFLIDIFVILLLENCIDVREDTKILKYFYWWNLISFFVLSSICFSFCCPLKQTAFSFDVKESKLRFCNKPWD
jgi:hypothetical protein